MHVGDTIFIFCLALIIFGPKKLPEIGRQIGKLMVEFRRASNEFKMQIEEELRVSDEAERQKEITAATTMMPAAAIATASLAGQQESSGPVIAPPSTGLPVNHTFASNEASPPDAALVEKVDDAYPEAVDEFGFNEGLNTASNGAADETAAEASAPFQVSDLGAPAHEPENAQASIHHG